MATTESLAGAADTGDRMKALVALRGLLARQIEVTDSGRDVAALSQRLMDVLEQIADLERAQPAKEGTALDEFTRRRSERQAAGSPSAAKRKQRR